MSDSLDAFLIKALRSPPDSTSRARKAWWSFCWWWSDHVWSQLPLWVRRPFWRVSRWWHSQVTCRLNPRQRWLTRQVPRDWCDVVQLTPLLLYAMVIHYCDPSGEDAFNRIVIEEPIASQLREVWHWAATGRAAVQAQLEASYPELPRTPKGLFDWEAFSTADLDYSEVNRLEALIEETDTRHLTWIVQSRAFLWI